MKLLVIQKFDLKIIITICYSIIIIKEYYEGICLKRHKCIHHAHPSASLLLKGNMSITIVCRVRANMN